MRIMGSASRTVIVAAQLLLLCACNTLAPGAASNHGGNDKPAGNSKAAPAASAVTSASALNEHNVIVPSPAVVKAGLEVSYSVKHLAQGKDALMQVSLVFRNATDKPQVVTPKVVITDGNGKVVAVYSKPVFNKVASRIIAGSKKSSDSSAIREQLDWDKAFWLERHFSIPAGGIQIGGLVYPNTAPAYPMQLVVSAEGRQYSFTIKDPGAAAADNPAADKKTGDCHSPALGTALYVGSDPACRK